MHHNSDPPIRVVNDKGGVLYRKTKEEEGDNYTKEFQEDELDQDNKLEGEEG